MIPKKHVFALAKALEGLPLLGTLEGTPAARAGVRYGDVLISVNGVRTKEVTDYVEAKNLRSDGMEIVIFRDGVNRTFELVFDRPAKEVDTSALLDIIREMRIAGDDDDDESDGAAAKEAKEPKEGAS